MKNIKIIFILSLLLVSCGDKGGGNWSAEMKATFMDSCVGEASLEIDAFTARDYCDCCVVELQKRYDMESFVSETMKMELGNPSDNFSEDMTEVIIECAGRFMEF